MNAYTRLKDDELEQLAQRRAGVRMGWYIHAAVFIAVNLMLVVASAMGGRHWATFPAFGWGVALAIHGAVVFIRTTGLHEQLVQRERERLSLQRDPW